MIIAAGCNLYLPWIIKDMIDDVLLNKDMETMKWICIGVVVVFLIRGVFYFGQTYLVSYVGQYAPKYDSASIHMSLDFTALLEWSIEGSGETNRMTIQYEILPDYNFLFDFVADMFMIKKTEGVLPACFVASDVAGGVFSEDKTEVRFQSTRYVPDTDCSEGICYTFRLRE